MLYWIGVHHSLTHLYTHPQDAIFYRNSYASITMYTVNKIQERRARQTTEHLFPFQLLNSIGHTVLAHKKHEKQYRFKWNFYASKHFISPIVLILNLCCQHWYFWRAYFGRNYGQLLYQLKHLDRKHFRETWWEKYYFVSRKMTRS